MKLGKPKTEMARTNSRSHFTPPRVGAAFDACRPSVRFETLKMDPRGCENRRDFAALIGLRARVREFRVTKIKELELERGGNRGAEVSDARRRDQRTS